jgi:hypothetical protein
MLKISYTFFFVILFCSLAFTVLAQTNPWSEETIPDKSTSTYATKDGECYVLIRRDGKGYQEGVAIKTTEKPTVQWNFYMTLNGIRHDFSLWGENYEEDSGPEISAKCLGQLYNLPENVQTELRKYGVSF